MGKSFNCPIVSIAGLKFPENSQNFGKYAQDVRKHCFKTVSRGYVTRHRCPQDGFVDHRTRHNVASMAAAPQGTELLIKGMAARGV